MEASLANAITTTTNGPTMAVQVATGRLPLALELLLAATGTSGAQSIIVDLEGSATGLGSWTAIKTYTFDGTYTKKNKQVQQVVRVPYIRLNVTTISGTGASLSATARLLGN